MCKAQGMKVSRGRQHPALMAPMATGHRCQPQEHTNEGHPHFGMDLEGEEHSLREEEGDKGT